MNGHVTTVNCLNATIAELLNVPSGTLQLSSAIVRSPLGSKKLIRNSCEAWSSLWVIAFMLMPFIPCKTLKLRLYGLRATNLLALGPLGLGLGVGTLTALPLDPLFCFLLARFLAVPLWAVFLILVVFISKGRNALLGPQVWHVGAFSR